MTPAIALRRVPYRHVLAIVLRLVIATCYQPQCGRGYCCPLLQRVTTCDKCPEYPADTSAVMDTKARLLILSGAGIESAEKPVRHIVYGTLSLSARRPPPKAIPDPECRL